jgi:tRNA(Ile)-lysidine synthase
MAHLFKACGYPLAMAHMNFQLRGEDSHGDEAFVRKLADELQIPLFVKKVETKLFAKKNHLSTQVAARDLRYAFFEELCVSHGFTKVAIAHHADDQAETFFINLQRRAGLRGLAGIPLERKNIIRPLLFATRAQIEAYAQQNNLTFRNDSSNNSDDYLRNRIRHHLLPKAEEVLPRFLSALTVTMNHLRETDEMIRCMIAEKQKALFHRMADEIRIPIKSLTKLRPLKTWLHYLLEDFGFNPEVIQSAAVAIESNQSGKVFLSNQYRMVIDRTEVIIVPLQQLKIAEEVILPADCTSIESPFRLDIKVIERTKNVNLKVAAHTALFDYDQLIFPLLLRPWRQGDRFYPYGMEGSKLVSDFLIDSKVSITDKEKTYVLLSGDKIIWVVGLRASRYAAVTRETKNIFKLNT